MKISTNQLFDRASDRMSQLQGKLVLSQAQLASSKQIIRPSDAPDQASVIQRFKSVLARQDSYLQSLDTIGTRLNNESSALQGVNNLLTRVKELTVQAANDTLSSGDRQALGTELQGLRDQMLSLANTQDSNGNYLFAGSRVRDPAFAADASGTPDYQGDQTRMSVMVGDERSLPINRAGSDAFVRVVRTDANSQAQGVGFFQVLDDLVKGVNGSDQQAMQRGLSEVNGLIDGVTLAQADVGTDQNVLQQQSDVISDTILSLKSSLSKVEDLDYAKAFVEMNKQMLSLQAAQSSFSKISQMSLFEYIR